MKGKDSKLGRNSKMDKSPTATKDNSRKNS